MLVLKPELAGQAIEAAWRTTSSSTRGHKADVVEIDIVLGEAPQI